jgi:hypothetical protein
MQSATACWQAAPLLPPAGSTIYMSEDWWHGYQLHRANTGVLLFVNNDRLPELLEEWLGYVQEKDEKVAYYRWVWAPGI